MDFMRLLKSVEEVLYELVTWILFYPLTLWRCVRHPIRMMTYAENELNDAPAFQFDDALSPPILLVITLFICHLITVQFGATPTEALPQVLQNEQNLIAFRAILFSIFPLFAALQSVRQRRAKLTRERLKPPFYSQCFVASPFILSLQLSVLLLPYEEAGPMTLALFLGGTLWYFLVQMTWLRLHGVGLGRALLQAAGTILFGFLVIAVTIITLLVSAGLISTEG